jgi:murein DD-endopeptidase MepM/ murein hydrolase activator NlpD
MEENQQKETLWERLQHNYRLTVMNHETFEEVGTYKLSLFNFYVALSVVVVVVAIFVILMMAFTPAKRLIPGFENVKDDGELLRISSELDSLEELHVANEVYINAFKNRLEGNVQTADDFPPEVETAKETTIEIQDSEADEILRREVEMEEISEVARRGGSGATVAKGTPLEQMYFTSPLSGEVSARFLETKDHYGTDIIAPKNTPVKAVMDGHVISSDWTLATGNTIGIQHTNDIITWYKHNSSLLKKAGDYVKAGEAVAIIGNTGDLTDGPHLHFELWHGGKAVDPEDYIQF